MPLSLNNNCPSMAQFQSPIEVSSTSIEQNVSIQENLMSLSLISTASTRQDSQRNWLYKSFFHFQFQINCNFLTELLQGINNLNSNFVRSVLTDIVEDCQFLWNLQSSLQSWHLCANCKFHASKFALAWNWGSHLWAHAHYCGYTVRREKLKEIKMKILAYFSWMCCVVTEFVHANLQSRWIVLGF